LWIDGLRRLIASGYTYQYLFRKKSRPKQKAYAVTILVDSVQPLFSSFSAFHTLSTTAALLGVLHLVPESDDIVVDVLASCSAKVSLLVNNLHAADFSEGGFISDLLRTVADVAGLESGVGIGLQTAMQIAARRSGVGMGRKIIVLTDGIVGDPSDVMTLKSALVDCQMSGIDVLGIGIGIGPVHLPELFPICLYAPNPCDLGSAMAAAFGISGTAKCDAIGTRQLFQQIDATKIMQIEELLCKRSAAFCPDLGKSIINQPVSEEFMACFGDVGAMFDVDPISGANPETEPWYDGVFEGFQILIVCLYMGANEGPNNRITKKTFDDQCGAALRRKGFQYRFVCSYGEGIQELQRNEGDRCQYQQLWLFSSAGYGTLPAEAGDKVTDKIVLFMDAVRDFWKRGAGLLLFCDNGPYIFEVNYLLKKCLQFSHNGRSGPTNVRLNGQWNEARGFYGYHGGKYITFAKSEQPAKQSFFPKMNLPYPGKLGWRPSLRPGLVIFYEGNTISYAVDERDNPLTSPNELWPFTAFAWTSENVSPPGSFVLFFDQEITCDSMECEGPIVLHRGFTSAFYGFGDDESHGTERLFISTACWLTRVEERAFRAQKTGSERLSRQFQG
jgi:hypothetical protein